MDIRVLCEMPWEAVPDSTSMTSLGHESIESRPGVAESPISMASSTNSTLQGNPMQNRKCRRQVSLNLQQDQQSFRLQKENAAH